MKMKAAVIHKPGDRFIFETVEIDDEPREDEVLVRIYACSICHTDELVRQTGATVKLPAILGHEGAGVVEKAGSQVTEFEPGDKVVLTVPHCGTCEACRKGQYLSCENGFNMYFGRKDGTPRIRDKAGRAVGHLMGQGGFAELVLCHKSSCVKIDKDVPFAAAAPVGCGFSTGSGTVLNFLKPVCEDAIAVYGVGSVGMAAVMGAKLAGCKTIIAIDCYDKKLELARELGATHTINSMRLEEEKGYSVEVSGPEAFITPRKYSLAEEVKRITNGQGVKFAVVTAPSHKVVTAAIYSCANGGECCVPASISPGEIPYQYMQTKNLRVSSCGMGFADKYKFFPYLLSEYKNGNYPIDRLLSYYQFDDIEQAFEDMEKGRAIKPVLLLAEE
ncbi:MAG: NAD(P)-dependent alcohol dehydrogenase [Lachnospiraceae bacterium]|nr:NAD(P)-dependent alcohol dehydrogenase [Lachnospiraceae bacterium]